MFFGSSFAWTIRYRHNGDEVVTLSPGHGALSVTVAPVVPVKRVVVAANATVVQAGTTGSSVIAHFAQCTTVG